MTSLKVENKKQVVYSTSQAVGKNVTTANKSLLSFKNTQNDKGLSVEHTSNPNQQYVKSYVKVKAKNGKTYNFNKTLEKRINNVTAKLQKAEKENGLIGKAWSWTKNIIGFGDSSDKVREIQANERKLLTQFNSNEENRPKIFLQLTGFKYTEENLEKFIKGQIKLKSEIAIEKYKEGQDISVDITSDIVSGVVAYGTATACIAGGIAAAPFTAGASLGAVAVGIGIAAGAGAATKVAIKGGESAISGKEYSLKQAGKDATIGAVSGALAPVTVGVGGSVANSVGKVAPKFVATTARLSAEGATFGAVDGGVRSVLEGDSVGEIALNTIKGAGTGILAGNLLGHGSNIVGKGIRQVYEKLTPVYHANGFTYRTTPFGKKYGLKLDKYKAENDIKFLDHKLRTRNPNPKNLTNELKKFNYGSSKIEEFLNNNPNLSPIVGSLPQKWGKTLASKQGLQQVDEIFYSISKLYTQSKLTQTHLKQAQEKLAQILGSEVKIEALGSGQVGMALKLYVKDQIFVLKCFKQNALTGHGNYDELASAVYASKNSPTQFAPFYMGRFGEKKDGYILTKFLEHSNKNFSSDFSLTNVTKCMCSCDKKSDNIIGKKIIDYGAAFADSILVKFNVEERKILRVLSKAIDDNNTVFIEKTLNKYANSTSLNNPINYIKSLVINNFQAWPYFIKRNKCLKMLNIEPVPSLNLLPTWETTNKLPELIFSNLNPHIPYYDSIGKYYGLSAKEWVGLFGNYGYNRKI